MIKTVFSKKILVAAVAAALILGGYLLFRGKKETGQNFTPAKRANIVQEVSVTGKVKSAESVDLAFEKSGRIVSIPKDVGSRVSAGETILELDTSELSANLNEAKANLEAGKADLDKAEITLSNYYDGVSDVVNDAYTKANDAVRKQIDDLFSDDETDNPQLTFSTSNFQNEVRIKSERLRASAELNGWLKELRSTPASATRETIDGLLNAASSRLLMIRNLLDLAMDAVLHSSGLSAGTASTYQTNITAARNSVDTALSNVNSQSQDIRSEKAAVSSAEAKVKSYEAAKAAIEAQIEKSVLRSPISGMVTKQDAKVGEVVAANSAIASVESIGDFEVEANVPEADIAKLKIGDKAKITLDAYPDGVVFEATVAAIDPAETVIDGVATYKTTLLFAKNDKRVKPGMTANIDVLTAKKENVIVVPQRAVFTKNGAKFVSVYAEGGKPEERTVETGLEGSDGGVEIVNGLKEGEKVITFGGTE